MKATPSIAKTLSALLLVTACVHAAEAAASTDAGPNAVLIRAEALSERRLPDRIAIPGRGFATGTSAALACMAHHAWRDALVVYLPDTRDCMPLRGLLALAPHDQTLPRAVRRAQLEQRLAGEDILVFRAELAEDSAGESLVGYPVLTQAIAADQCSCPDPGNATPVLAAPTGAPQQVAEGAAISTIGFSATDSDGDTLTPSFSFRKDTGLSTPGLPGGLVANCTGNAGTLSCPVTGTAPATLGEYVIRLSVSDGLASASRTATLTVTSTRPAGSLTVSAISGSTTESGGRASFTVVLDNPPTQDVFLSLSSNDPGEGTVTPTSLTFTPGDWNVPQPVTVTGVDDDIQDGPVTFQVLTSNTQSTDGLWDDVAVDNVDVVNLDNEVVTRVDRPAGGLAVPLDCGAGALQRRFAVDETRAVFDVNVGLSVAHGRRGDLAATLESPDGTVRSILLSDAGDLNADYDVLFDGDGGGATNSGANDDLGAPIQDRRVLQAALTDYKGEIPLGDWVLTLCDAAPGIDDGNYLGAFLEITPLIPNAAEFCNGNVVTGVTASENAAFEACEVLSVGPLTGEADADIYLSSGWEILIEPEFEIQQGATLRATTSGQSLCLVSAEPMPRGSHSCVDQICEVNSACCDSAFSQQCLDQVQSICGLSCDPNP
ncbi:MAG: proprotein convertase P-domain-containing protein [Xanthomonadales bacterium]|nr:proprotein convertase P-domain-containing protein [Xanthomonadales bacterium]